MKLVPLFALVITFVLTAFTATAQSEYRIKSGDTLQVEVLEDASLNRSVAVLPNGQITFPFAGTINAGGQTVSEVQSAIRAAISSNFASTPTVFVGVVPRVDPVFPNQNNAPAQGPTISIYFLGEVNTPGAIQVKPGTTLLQAMAVGGGVSRFAAVKRIQLRRTDPRTRAQSVTILNYKALANGAVSNDIELKDGDVILVPERRLFE